MAIIKSRRLTWATMALAQEGSALSHRGALSHSSSWLLAAVHRVSRRDSGLCSGPDHWGHATALSLGGAEPPCWIQKSIF